MIVASQVRKCSRAGCHNVRLDEAEFCAACLTSGRAKPTARATCDELTMIPPNLRSSQSVNRLLRARKKIRVKLHRPGLPKSIDDSIDKMLLAKSASDSTGSSK